MAEINEIYEMKPDSFEEMEMVGDEDSVEENKENEKNEEEEEEENPNLEALNHLESLRTQLIEVLRSLVAFGTSKSKLGNEDFETIKGIAKTAKELYIEFRDTTEMIGEEDPNLLETFSDLDLNTDSIKEVTDQLRKFSGIKNHIGITKRLDLLKTPLGHLLKFRKTLANLTGNEAPLEEEEEEKDLPDFPMNEGQQAVYDKIMDQIENKKEGPALKLFLSGTAGTGKSFVIKKIREKLERDNGSHTVVVCGTTGVASVAIGGRTVHSALMLPIDHSEKPKRSPGHSFAPLDKFFFEILSRKLKGLVLLVIDEISMLSNIQLYMIDARLREILGNGKEFGGVNVVLMGDLLQLPPVKAQFIFQKIPQNKRPHWLQNDSDLWQKFEYMELSQNCRVQSGPESEFAQVLAKIREGHHGRDVVKYVNRIERIDPPKDVTDMEKELLEENPGKTFIVLCTDNKIAAAVNEKNINLLTNRQTFEATFESEKTLSGSPGDPKLLETRLEVAPTARVMLLCNLSVINKMVNGSIGSVVKIEKDGITVKFDACREPEKIKRISIEYKVGKKTWYKTQFPLRLAYASTVHKAQGLTFDGVIMNVTKMFASGQFFVMLSRARDISLCRITGKNPLAVRVDAALHEECNRLRETAGLPRIVFNRKL